LTDPSLHVAHRHLLPFSYVLLLGNLKARCRSCANSSCEVSSCPVCHPDIVERLTSEVPKHLKAGDSRLDRRYSGGTTRCTVRCCDGRAHTSSRLVAQMCARRADLPLCRPGGDVAARRICRQRLESLTLVIGGRLPRPLAVGCRQTCPRSLTPRVQAASQQVARRR
jgi:hypothetical protein